MHKVLLFSILILLVYQFDDLVRMGYFMLRRFTRGHITFKQLVLDSDQFVGTAMAMIGMPLALNYLVISDDNLSRKLFWIALGFLVFAAISASIEVIHRRGNLQRYEKVNALASAAYLVAGAFHPVFRTVKWSTGRERVMLAKLALSLSVPAILGLGFRWYFGQGQFEAEFMKYMDVLIVAMVGGLFMNIIISFLQKYFRRNHSGILSYFRVALGLGIAFLLIK